MAASLSRRSARIPTSQPISFESAPIHLRTREGRPRSAAEQPERDPRLHPRNRCLHEGYASVALIPIRSGEEIIDTIPESVFMVGADGRVLAANDTFAERVGASTEQVLGDICYDLIPPAAAARRRAWVEEVVRAGEILVREDEREGRFLLHHMCPVKADDGSWRPR